VSSTEFDRADAAAQLLDWFTTLMPARRSEWSRAMRAELHHIAGGPARWTFVLGCVWVALRTCALEGKTMTSCSPPAGRTAVVACGGGALMVMPFIGLESASAGVSALRTIDAAMLFGMLWTLAAMTLFVGIRLILSFKAERSRPQPVLLLQVIVLVLAAVGWLGIIGDQMPCFLGEPNCD
jgi:hypothetical protein